MYVWRQVKEAVMKQAKQTIIIASLLLCICGLAFGKSAKALDDPSLTPKEEHVLQAIKEVIAADNNPYPYANTRAIVAQMFVDGHGDEVRNVTQCVNVLEGLLTKNNIGVVPLP